jgi:hypothetical protein
VIALHIVSLRRLRQMARFEVSQADLVSAAG